MTITITRLDYTRTIDALVTGACRHAEHAAPGDAVELYDIAADLNAVAKRIYSRPGLADILNSKLPPAGAAPDDEDTGVNAQILQLIADSDNGLTNDELATELGYEAITVRKITAALCKVGKLAYTVGDQQAKRYTLASAQPAAVDDTPAPITDTVDVPPAVVKILNSPAPRQPRRKDAVKTRQRIIEYIAAHPLCTQDELTIKLNISPTNVHMHIRDLMALGDIVIDHQRRGRAYRYRLADPTTVATAAD